MEIIVFAILILAIPFYIMMRENRREEEEQFQRDQDLHDIAEYIRNQRK